MHILLDLLFMYTVCGLAIVIFLQMNDLFFYTTSNFEQDDSGVSTPFVAKTLLLCVSAGIFITAVTVWPLVLATCIMQRDVPNDEF